MYVLSTGQAVSAQPEPLLDRPNLLMAGGLVVFIGGLALINRQVQKKRPKRKLTKKEQRWQSRTLLVLTVAGPFIYYGFMQR
jgi:small neutral amino acid transporter SnatA (MarC family)